MRDAQAFPTPSPGARLRAVWTRHAKVYGGTFVSNVTPAVFEPLFFMAAVGLGLGKFITAEFQGLPYVEFMCPGVLAMTALYTASFEATYGTFVRMKFQRTYDAMLATPLVPRDVVLGELLFCGTKGLLFSAIVGAVLAAAGAVSSWGALLVPAAGFVVALAFAGAGFVVAARVTNMNHFQFYFTAVLTPLVMFSGLTFPVSELPAPLMWAAVATPMFPAVETMRLLVSGPEHLATPDAVWCPVLLVLWTIVLCWFGVRAFEKSLAR
ncbi:MAG: hypothetical protein HMLKMBBP_03846 [Planctomycetes bacterium]|nr:hypothetical protein [Planctomycetota bacterium]